MIHKIFISRKNKNKKTQYFLMFFMIVLSLYTTINQNNNRRAFFPNFISEARAQETDINKQQTEKIGAIKKAAKGFFTHIRFADTLYDMNQLSFKDIEGKDHNLSEFRGKPILVNLWAVWCAPCRAEMPELARLKCDMGGNNFDVIAINIDKNTSAEKIQKFLNDAHADNLVYYRDNTMNIFQDIRKKGLALGLPITFLINKDGYLIASFNGAAPWADDDAKALIKAVIEENL
ncbi:Thiol-disulfide isomerase or thioredoxin [Bartonella sp. CDC_skunk]|uniref:TlpA disulfide reductase family protein n=1 Tax=unclassified Bartonella TaxID=2645622 RepID=UPI0009996988|nr:MULTISPECIES: TlpA disulfide reductase family protein [unclassified Bartonella]AQX18984.1 Thiol-disulfide isomerase or thioredoxin [Bartonella sp. A1379B]AQX21991.1 Thiol-disulfide isomerase or thioredoxin [Bartonella sp. CDC_skunk]AQX27264.1 Thiol-disulfide isomerase or thioredoxin [Bartonella sp. Raccoon60]